MRLEVQILAAFLLDMLLGDPRWLPHPVRGIAWVAGRLEGVARCRFPVNHFTTTQRRNDGDDVESSRETASSVVAAVSSLRRGSNRKATAAGTVTALGTYVIAGGAAWGAICLAGWAHPLAGDVMGVLAIYTAIAARDLARHANAVMRPLAAGDLPAARERVAMIVGRDVDRLDEAEVSRAAVESVAESTVDGVTAPLFWAMVAGPVGAVVYRAVNTLDSMFGHKDERYIDFGWASARIDDLANFIPARLTAPLMCLASAMLGHNGVRAWRIWQRDGRKHASPNSGLTEAAMAGAMGVQLGGTNYYDGVAYPKATIGDAVAPLSWRHIRQANALMFVTVAMFIAAGLGVRWWVLSHGWRIGGGL